MRRALVYVPNRYKLYRQLGEILSVRVVTIRNKIWKFSISKILQLFVMCATILFTIFDGTLVYCIVLYCIVLLKYFLSVKEHFYSGQIVQNMFLIGRNVSLTP